MAMAEFYGQFQDDTSKGQMTEFSSKHATAALEKDTGDKYLHVKCL